VFTKKVSMSDKTQTIKTEHHTIEIDPVDYLLIKDECRKLGITTDYYFFEFQYYQDEN
tara:strand:+ start:216 stop:389 length:174 start_codon:yes stop_codon:yes gene_type:complete